MNNYFLQLINEQEDLQDIRKYLHIPFEHLENIKLTINHLNCHEHTEDILNESQFIESNLLDFIEKYLALSINERNSDFFPDSTLTYKNYFIYLLEQSCSKIYELEQELHADFPENFNYIENWPSFISFKNEYLLNNLDTHLTDNIVKNTSKKSVYIKDFYFGFLFLIPAFIWFLVIPYLDNLSYKNNIHDTIIIDDDRSYKNLIYLYSAIKQNKEQQYNFYSLIKSTYFKIPEGFTLIDKNSLADYYGKHYYEYKLNEDNIPSLYLNNLNFKQCKYILTKILNIEENIKINNQEILLNNDSCLKSNNNSVIIIIKSLENK